MVQTLLSNPNAVAQIQWIDVDLIDDHPQNPRLYIREDVVDAIALPASTSVARLMTGQSMANITARLNAIAIRMSILTRLGCRSVWVNWKEERAMQRSLCALI